MNARTTTVDSPYAERLSHVPVERGEIELRGARTATWTYGDPAAQDTILVVHGFRGDHHGLEPVVAELGPGLRVVAPDLPGFGESEPFSRGGHDIAAYGEWLRELIATTRREGRLVVLGHSFGSIVVAAALADREQPDGIVLVNPIAAPALAGPRGVMTRLAVLYYRLATWLPERAGLALLRSPLIVRIMSVTMAKTRDRALRRWIHFQHELYFSRFSDRRTVLEAFQASVGNDVSEFASRIPAPTLLVVAERDDIAPLAAQERLQPLFPDARLRRIPEVGHLIHYETPAAAAEFIREFVASLPRERA